MDIDPGLLTWHKTQPDWYENTNFGGGMEHQLQTDFGEIKIAGTHSDEEGITYWSVDQFIRSVLPECAGASWKWVLRDQ